MQDDSGIGLSNNNNNDITSSNEITKQSIAKAKQHEEKTAAV